MSGARDHSALSEWAVAAITRDGSEEKFIVLAADETMALRIALRQRPKSVNGIRGQVRAVRITGERRPVVGGRVNDWEGWSPADLRVWR